MAPRELPFKRAIEPSHDNPRKTNRDSATTAAIMRLVELSSRHAWPVILTLLLLAIVSASYFTRHFVITTDSNKLLSSSLPWRQQERMLDAAFPQRIDQIIAVVDATTPEAADDAAAALVNALSPRSDVIRTVSRPDGGEFFERNGILFLSIDEVSAPPPTSSPRSLSSERWPRIRRCAVCFARYRSRSKACAWEKQSWKISSPRSLRSPMRSISWRKERPRLSPGAS